jgi:hypothetical protein
VSLSLNATTEQNNTRHAVCYERAFFHFRFQEFFFVNRKFVFIARWVLRARRIAVRLMTVLATTAIHYSVRNQLLVVYRGRPLSDEFYLILFYYLILSVRVITTYQRLTLYYFNNNIVYFIFLLSRMYSQPITSDHIIIIIIMRKSLCIFNVLRKT